MKKFIEMRDQRAQAARYAMTWVKEYLGEMVTVDTRPEITLLMGDGVTQHHERTGAIEHQLMDMVFGGKRTTRKWPQVDVGNFIGAWNATKDGVILENTQLGRLMSITGIDLEDVRRRLFLGLEKSGIIHLKSSAASVKRQLIFHWLIECQMYIDSNPDSVASKFVEIYQDERHKIHST